MGTLRDSSGKAVKSGSGEDVKTRYDDDEDKKQKEDKYDLEAVGGSGRRARTIEEQIGRKAESKSEPSKSSGRTVLREEADIEYSGPKGIFSNPGYTPSEASPISSGDKAVETIKRAVRTAAKAADNKAPAPKNNKPSAAETKAPAPKPKEEPEKDSKAEDKPKEKKYGIGPHGAFSSIHKFFSDDRTDEEKKKSADSLYKAWKGKKSGGAVKMAKGGSVSSASKRADGIAQRGKTRGRVV